MLNHEQQYQSGDIVSSQTTNQEQKNDGPPSARNPDQSDDKPTTNKTKQPSSKAGERSQRHNVFNSRPFIDPNLLLTASDYKLAGNKLCSLFRYEEAITYYSKAISKSPDVAIFYSNRALCHIKLQQWSKAVENCRRALELEPNSIKAHFFLGQALAELVNYDDALKHLQRAHKLAKEEKLNFGDDIAYQIRLVKRRRWSKVEAESSQLEDELHIYLVNLINKDREEKLRQLKSSPDKKDHMAQGGSWHPIPSSSSAAEPVLNTDNETYACETQEVVIQERCDSYIAKLDTMFNDLRLKRKKCDVPDYLCGKISFEIMHDPVITPSGITYDRPDIEEHLRRVGHFDPITRQPLKANQLISNLAMKEVVDAYLNDNEWALYY